MKIFLNIIKITGLAAILAVGVSYVSAAPWSAPGTNATGGNTVAAVNTSDYGQTKIGSFSTNSFFKAGNAFSSLNAPWNKAGYIVGEKAIISPWSFFTYSFLPGTASQVKIGSDNADTTDPFTGAITPFTIDLVGRGGYNTSSGRNMVDIRTDTNACYPNATIRTNTPSVALYNADGSDYASPMVRGVQLSGGNPAPGKILVSTDKYGNAIWATPVYNSGTGKITFTYGTSPVADGQNICGAQQQQPADVCPNIAGSQTVVPNGMVVDSSGNCITPPPAVDLCTNIAGNQATVPTGMVKDTPGDTPGNCTTPPVDVCPNIGGNQATVPTGYELNNNQCEHWVAYAQTKGSVGQSCRSWMTYRTPGYPYTPIVTGKYRTVQRESLPGGLTGGIINRYVDKCIYAQNVSNNNTSYTGVVIGDFDTVPVQSGKWYYPISGINGLSPRVVYEFQFKDN